MVEVRTAGHATPDKVNVRFERDGRYEWAEGAFRLQGRWKLSSDMLELTQMRPMQVQLVSDQELHLHTLGSTLRLQRGPCPAAGFSSQERLAFHNAAFSGDLQALADLVRRGFPVDTPDDLYGDTGLIKAAKNCQLAVARTLLEHKADPRPANQEGRTALDYATRSNAPAACEPVARLLRPALR
ncbi:ankyrin repeat domain-containing protein [Acidovorax lacteus]